MNEQGIRRLRGVLRRRKVAVIATFVGTLAVGIALTLAMEPSYKASAILRAAEVQPAKEYVAPTVAEQIGERLKSLRLAVMSRPIVMQAAQELDLFRGYKKMSKDEVVDSIRARMDVKLEGEDTFLITYSDSNPDRARAIVDRVAQLFMKQQVERRQAVATATEEALQNEVDALKPEMESADQKLRKFKLEHYGALPEQLEGNLRNLDQTTMEVNIQSTNLDMNLERRRQLLAQALSPLRHHEETMAAQMHDARTHYTEDMPEYQRIKAEYARVHDERLADEKDLTQKVRRNNPELAALDGEIDRTKAWLGGLRERQADVRKRVEATARNGQDLAGLQLQFDGIKDKYALALSHLRDAQLALGLERGLASMRFDLVEGAATPAHAASPNKPLFALGALILAIALALGVGFALEMGDTTVREPADMHQVAPSTPILAVIPHTHFTKPTPHAEA
jgi:succinoglycan biosynthesis transport protein ExoP